MFNATDTELAEDALELARKFYAKARRIVFDDYNHSSPDVGEHIIALTTAAATVYSAKLLADVADHIASQLIEIADKTDDVRRACNDIASEIRNHT